MDITKKVQISADATNVYKAITTQAGLEGWWNTNCNISSKVGEISTFKFDKQGMIVDMHFRIDELQENKKVVWTCIHNTNPTWVDTVVSFEISGNGSTTDVTFKHDGFAQADQMIDETWSFFMNSLKNYVESGAGQPWA